MLILMASNGQPAQAKSSTNRVGTVASGLLGLLIAACLVMLSVTTKEITKTQSTQINIIVGQQNEIAELQNKTAILSAQTQELMRQLERHEQLQPYRRLALREAPHGLACPAYNSPQAKQAVNPRPGSRVNVPKSHMGNMLVLGAGNTVHIGPTGSIGGNLILCGASNILVLDGNIDTWLKGRVLMQGAGVKVMLIDETPDPNWSKFFGNNIEVWRCTAKSDPRYQACTF